MQSLFRVLFQRGSQEIVLRELTTTADGSTAATETDPIRASTESEINDVEFVLNLLSPGHLVSATLGGSEPHEIVDIEHRGGVTFEMLDPWLPPYSSLDVWRENKQAGSDSQQNRIVKTVQPENEIDPLSSPDPIGEITLIFTKELDTADSQEDFHQTRNIEPFLQNFQKLPGEPMEVLAADPHGVPFWCVLTFDSEDSSIAQKTRSQYGSCQKEEFISNPLINVVDSNTTQPSNPENPKQVIGEDYQQIPSEAIPNKTGRGTIKIARELTAMSRGFSVSGLPSVPLRNQSETLSLQNVSAVSAEQYSDAIKTIGDAFIGYIRTVLQIYETMLSASTSDPETLVEQGDLPNAELLSKSEKILRQYLSFHQGFNLKMQNIDIEAYFPNIISLLSESRQREIEQMPHVDPIPDELETVANQQCKTVDKFRSKLQEYKNIVDTTSNGSEIQYTLPIVSEQSTERYSELKRTRDEEDSPMSSYFGDNEEMEMEIPEQYKKAAINDHLLECFSSVDIQKGSGGCQSRYEWFMSPEIDFKSFRTV